MAEPFPPHFSDCTRDVLALVEAYLAVSGASVEQSRQAAADFRLLMDNADLHGCLRVAVPLLAYAWKANSDVKAAALGTSAEDELSGFLDRLRRQLCGLLCR